MTVTRDVILDLLPLYLAGEASPATQALVEEHLKHDAELDQHVCSQKAESLQRIPSSKLPPDLELRSMKRARTFLTLQKWFFGFALFFAAFGLSVEFSTEDGHLQEFHFLIRDHPALFGAFFGCSLVCFISYFAIRHRTRTLGV